MGQFGALAVGIGVQLFDQVVLVAVLLDGAMGRMAGIGWGALNCPIMTALAMPLNIRRDGECGERPTSPMRWTLMTSSALGATATKKS